MEIDTDIDIKVNDGVYKPDDDSFLLISLIKVLPGERVLEIGCGSGIISIHCAKAGASVTSLDIDPKALELTKQNAASNGVILECSYLSDMFESIQGRWDVIIFNPPYLPAISVDDDMDPRWDGGVRGDETIIRFLEDAKKYLEKDGRLYFCCSDMSPMEEILCLIESHYRVICRRSKTFDFESLYVYELKMKEN